MKELGDRGVAEEEAEPEAEATGGEQLSDRGVAGVERTRSRRRGPPTGRRSRARTSSAGRRRRGVGGVQRTGTESDGEERRSSRTSRSGVATGRRVAPRRRSPRARATTATESPEWTTARRRGPRPLKGPSHLPACLASQVLLKNS